jgi:hypothetical protein
MLRDWLPAEVAVFPVRKHRSVLLLLVDLLVAGDLWCQAASLQDSLREMDVSLDLPGSIVPIAASDGTDPPYQLAFRITGARYEVRISLYPWSALVRHSGNGDIERYLPLFSMGLLAAIAEQNLSLCTAAELPGPLVKKEFGADKGMTALVAGSKSAFSAGFAQIAVVFLYKAGKGVVVVSMLYNEPGDLQMDGLAFSQAYYCFRFNESAAK